MENIQFKKVEHTPAYLRYRFKCLDKYNEYTGNVTLSEFNGFEIFIKTVEPAVGGCDLGGSVKELSNHLDDVEKAIIIEVIRIITERGN